MGWEHISEHGIMPSYFHKFNINAERILYVVYRLQYKLPGSSYGFQGLPFFQKPTPNCILHMLQQPGSEVESCYSGLPAVPTCKALKMFSALHNTKHC